MRSRTTDILQIDLIKGLAIIIVVIGHIVAYQAITTPQGVLSGVQHVVDNPITIETKFDFVNLITINTIYPLFTHWSTYSVLFTQQVLPIFLITMSFNLSLAYHRRGYLKLNQFYSLNEMKKKFRRYFIPFILIFSFSLLLGLVFFLLTNRQILYLNFRLLIGYLPINGPGNYFIALILQMVLLFPLLFIFYKYNRNLCLISGFFLAFLCEIINHFGVNGIWYIDSLVRFFPHIVLGIWISDLYLSDQLKNKYFIIFGILSGFYLIFISQFEKGVLSGIPFYPYTASQNVLGCGWSALMLIIGLLYLPEVNNTITKPFAIFGKASYHIFLLQIVYFGIIGGYGLKYHSLLDLCSINNIFYIVISLTIVLIGGIGFYLFDKHNFFLGKRLI